MDGRSLQGAHLWRWLQYYPHYSHQWSCRVSIIVELLMISSMQRLNYQAFTGTSVWFNFIKHHPKCNWPQSKVTILCCCWWLQKHNGGYHKGEMFSFHQYVFLLKIIVLMQRNLLLQGGSTHAWTRKNTKCFKRGDLSHTGADRKNQCQYCSDILQGRLSILYISGFVSTLIYLTFFSKQISILCLSAFVLKHYIWKRILTSSGCQKMAWLKTLSWSLKNTSRPGDCWYVALVMFIFDTSFSLKITVCYVGLFE